MNKPTPFDYIKAVFEKRDWPDTGKDFHFIAMRYFSMYPNTILEAVSIAQYLGKIGHSEFGQLLFHVIPKEKPAPFIRYIKKGKETKYDKPLLEAVCKAYSVNEKHGSEIIEIAKANKVKLKKSFGLK